MYIRPGSEQICPKQEVYKDKLDKMKPQKKEIIAATVAFIKAWHYDSCKLKADNQKKDNPGMWASNYSILNTIVEFPKLLSFIHLSNI